MKRKKICALISGSSLIVLVGLFCYGTPLPPPSGIAPEIARGFPIQTDLPTAPPFSVDRGGYHYTIIPHASYTLSGLVVSLHHSDSFIDISHKDDPAQTVDVCVVWGPDITTGGYRNVSYAHGDFTCYYSWGGENDPAFSGDFLSNNHLIPETPELAALIKRINVGDQIELSGELVDYRVSKDGVLLGQRNTSLVRTDMGNGACEVIYLTEAHIIKANMPWRTPFIYMLFALVIGLGLIGFFTGMPKLIATQKDSSRQHTLNPFDPKNYRNDK